MPSINFKDAAPLNSGFDALPRGVYSVEITDAKIETSKNTGAEMLKLEYTVVDDGETSFAGRKVWEYLTFGENSVEISARKLKTLMLAVDFDEETIDAMDEFGPDEAADLIGYELAITVGVEKGKGEYEGQEQNRVKNYAPLVEEAIVE